MKKVKIMLMAILIMAIAGGAIAFKTKFGNAFCTGEPTINLVNGQFTCTDAGGNELFCWETVFFAATTNVFDPNAILKCTTALDPVLECDIECPVLIYTTTEDL